MSATDHFPTTQQTWILDRIAEGHGGSSAMRSHNMTRYREPLLAYVRGSTLRANQKSGSLPRRSSIVLRAHVSISSLLV